MKPLALDLCCGKGGWTIGLQSAGWDVIGFDITAWEGYPGQGLIVGDVREINAKPWKGKVSLVTASPPCQEFSYRSFPFKRCRDLAANVPPDKSIWEACVRIAKEVGAPLVLENVRGAQPYMGKASAHYGSFYLWGDVPALLPIGRPTKGFQNNSKNNGFRGNALSTSAAFGWNKEKVQGQRVKVLFEDMPHSKMGSHSNARKEWAAKIAMIPPELGAWIGEVFKPTPTDKED